MDFSTINGEKRFLVEPDYLIIFSRFHPIFRRGPSFRKFTNFEKINLELMVKIGVSTQRNQNPKGENFIGPGSYFPCCQNTVFAYYDEDKESFSSFVFKTLCKLEGKIFQEAILLLKPEDYGSYKEFLSGIDEIKKALHDFKEKGSYMKILIMTDNKPEMINMLKDKLKDVI